MAPSSSAKACHPPVLNLRIAGKGPKGRTTAGQASEAVKKSTVTVMLSPFGLPLRTALSAAKGLRINSAKHPRVCKAKEIRGFFVASGSSE
jgi:hypothetical protein